MRYGAEKKGSARLSAQLEQILSVLPVLPLAGEADRHYGKIRAELERKGTPIGPHDMLIASHARAAGLTLVTNNLGEFKRIGKLKLTDWL